MIERIDNKDKRIIFIEDDSVETLPVGRYDIVNFYLEAEEDSGQAVDTIYPRGKVPTGVNENYHLLVRFENNKVEINWTFAELVDFLPTDYDKLANDIVKFMSSEKQTFIIDLRSKLLNVEEIQENEDTQVIKIRKNVLQNIQ